MADRAGAKRIVDLGCGAGSLTGPGRTVIGIDPAAAMVAYATARPGGAAVEWRLGTSERIDTNSVDLIIMSANVAMHILGDDWTTTLADVARGLVPGGTLAFDSRNPAVRAWRTWNDKLNERRTALGRLRESTSTTEPDVDGIVTMSCHNDFVDAGGVLDVEQRLQFRTSQQVTADLQQAGLTVHGIWRNWDRTPFTGDAKEQLMVFEATR